VLRAFPGALPRDGIERFAEISPSSDVENVLARAGTEEMQLHWPFAKLMLHFVI
jgi:hypothetical protein